MVNSRRVRDLVDANCKILGTRDEADLNGRRTISTCGTSHLLLFSSLPFSSLFSLVSLL